MSKIYKKSLSHFQQHIWRNYINSILKKLVVFECVTSHILFFIQSSLQRNVSNTFSIIGYKSIKKLKSYEKCSIQ